MNSTMKSLPAAVESGQLADGEGTRPLATIERGQLLAAVESGHLNAVKHLISNGADINETDDRNNTSLHIAIRKGFDDIVTYLMNNDHNKANVNAATSNGETPLHEACDKVNMNIVRQLLELGASTDVQLNYLHPREGTTPLMYAVPSPYELTVNKRKKSEMLEMMCCLIRHGCNLNLQDCRGNTALHRATDFGDAHTVALLVDNGADMFVRNKFGLTPLHMALEPDIPRYSVAIYLVLYGCMASEINDGYTYASRILKGIRTLSERIDDAQMTCLVELITNDLPCDLRPVNLIDTDCQSYDNHSPESLQQLCRRVARRCIHKPLHKHVEMLHIAPALKRYLVLSVPNPLRLCDLQLAIQESNLPDIEKSLPDFTAEDLNVSFSSQTSLTLAAAGNSLEVVRMLLDHGAGLDVLDNSGSAALHEAAKNGSLDIVQLLKVRGANLDVKNRHDECALIKAAENGHFNIVIFLLETGCQLTNLYNRHRFNVLHFAAGSGAHEAVHALLARGMSPDVTDSYGNTPLHVAATKGFIYYSNNPERLPALFRTQDSITYEGLRSVMGLTPRPNVTVCHAGVVRLLMDSGADKNFRNESGMTAEQLAKILRSDNQDILELLSEL